MFICSYTVVSVYWLLSVLWKFACVCVCVCVCMCVYVCLWYQIRVPAKNHIICQTSAAVMPCFIKHTARSLWYYGNMVNIGRSILQLSKRIYRMWHDHPFSQRNKTTKRAVGVRGWRLEVGGWRQWGSREEGWTKCEKER